MTLATTRRAFAPAPRLEGLTAYRGATFRAPIELRLDGNEGPPVAARSLTLEGEELRRYPDARGLETTIAKRIGLPAASGFLLGTGADELLDRLARAFVAPGDRVVWTTPGFGMIARSIALAGGELVNLPWSSGPFPREAFLRAVRESEATLALVVTPNNPTGLALDRDELTTLRQELGDTALVLDLVYDDYADTPLRPTALKLPNTLVLGSLSKADSLAGLRIGWAAGPRGVIEDLRRAGPPYALSTPSLRLAEVALNDPEAQADARTRRERIVAERSRLTALLEERGFRPPRAQGNFVYAEDRRAPFVVDALAGLGIGIRGFPAAEGRPPALRITLPGDATDFARLMHGLDVILAPQALLFDMDGVLADVSASYRESIRRTAADLGVTLDDGDIAAAKRKGDANDDWELTRRLLAARGVELTLAEVRDRFEAHYQGSVSTGVGLRERETALVTPARLRSLAGVRPLAIVTGRPRDDARRFLETMGFADLPRTVIAREDAAPLKPDPAPVRLALRRLGRERAWMIGDTPDDVRAARAAGVLPLGIVAPGSDRARDTDALLSAGAARVLESLDELEDLLP